MACTIPGLSSLFRRFIRKKTYPGSLGPYQDGSGMARVAEQKSVQSIRRPPTTCKSCWLGLFSEQGIQEALSSRSLFDGFSYSTSWAKVEASAKSGCQWCALVLSARHEVMQHPVLRIIVGIRPTSPDDTATPKGVQVLRLVINGTPHSTYYVYTDAEDPAAEYIVARSRILQVDSPHARMLASQCIMNCIRNHERCPSPHEHELPTRVVDCSDPSRPKLVTPQGAKGPYLALSYVWGEPQPHSTTTQNIATYLNGIDPSLLPQTITDAIATTHALGLQYLWTDTLCILQDSIEDKKRELALMRRIYRDAYFTIIAASASKASAGFLQDRPLASPTDLSLPFQSPKGGALGAIHLSPVWKQYDGSTEPVHMRAWCLQERLLSPRALVFASHTLQYHCQTSIVNLGDAVCAPMIGQRLPPLMFLPDTSIPATIARSSKDFRILRWSWAEVVADYTRRALSDPADKLVALAAVAEQFQQLWKMRYRAGLWADTLLEDLLWCRDGDARAPRSTRYRAPSWSWAAVDGRVVPMTLDDRLNARAEGRVQTAEVVRCEVALEDARYEFGRVEGGTLVLCAPLVKATWNPEAQAPDLVVERAAVPDPLLDVTTEEEPPPHVLVGCAFPDSANEVGMREVWAVPVRWNTHEQYAAGLLVVPLDPAAGMDGEETVYRRVGYFHSPEYSPCGLKWFDTVSLVDIEIV